MSALDLLNQTCTLSAPTITVETASGQNSYSFSNVATAVRCSIQPRRTYDRNNPARETGVTEFVVYFPPTQTVEVDYRITSIAGGAGYAGAWAGKTLGVVSLWMDGAGRGQYKAVVARLVDGGPTP